MATSVRMINKNTGIIKEGFVGFSWTYFFFGFFVPLLRGHYPMAGIHFLVSIANAFSFGVIGLVMAFIFNKFYTLRLIEDGFEFADEESKVRNACALIGVDYSSAVKKD